MYAWNTPFPCISSNRSKQMLVSDCGYPTPYIDSVTRKNKLKHIFLYYDSKFKFLDKLYLSLGIIPQWMWRNLSRILPLIYFFSFLVSKLFKIKLVCIISLWSGVIYMHLYLLSCTYRSPRQKKWLRIIKTRYSLKEQPR